MLSPKHTRVLLRLALGAIVLAVLTHTRADPDLFGHVRFGQDLVAARSVHLADSYSFTSDRPWINHEWLSEAVMYFAYDAAGNAGLIALKISLLAVMLAAVAWTLARYGLPAFGRDLLIALVVIGTFPQANHVRPQLFSLALFACLLAVLVASQTRRIVLVWSIPIMAVWVNLHGGWLVGAGALVAWTGAGLISPRTRRDALVGMAVGAVSAAATLLNPYGPEMWSFLHGTVGLERADITDWQPVFALGAPYVALWILTAAAAAIGIRTSLSTARGKRVFDLRALAIVVLFGVAALRVSRLLSFFTISTVMLMGPQIVAAFARSPRRRVREHAPSRLAAGIAVAVALALTIGGAAASAANVGCIRMEASMFPEPDVAAVVAGQRVRGRMLTWFDWGEYAIWHFAPDVAVSMDGRRETVYSDVEIQRQLKFYSEPAERAAILDALKPDYIWVPSNLAVTAKLIEDGWRPAFAGPRSTLLAKKSNRAAPGANVNDDWPSGSSSAPRCFPGP